jgi:hypothetical protein
MTDIHRTRLKTLPRNHGLRLKQKKKKPHFGTTIRRNTMKNKRPLRPVEERFWEKVDKTGDCWVWKAHLLYNGYGRFSINLKTEYSHRVAWFLEHGEWPKGKHVTHICDNPACVRPDHLVLGTVEDNMADRNAKKRQYNHKKLHCRHGMPFSYEGKYRIAKDCSVCEISRQYKKTIDPEKKRANNRKAYLKRKNKGK